MLRIKLWLQFAATLPFAILALPGCTPRTTAAPAATTPTNPAPRLVADAEPGPTVDVLHGERIADPFRWLEDDRSGYTQRWLDSQNAKTEMYFAGLDDVCDELVADYKQVVTGAVARNPTPVADRFFELHTPKGGNQPALFVREGSYEAAPRICLNPNDFSDDGTVAMDWWYPAPCGKLIAYGLSEGGTEKSTLYIRNVDTGEDLDDVIPFTQYCYVAWAPDSSGFYYNRSPDPSTVPAGEENFHMRVYYHELGTDYHDDRYVWGEGRPIDEEPNPYTSSDGSHVLLNFYRDPSVNDLFIGRFNEDQPLRPVAAGIGAITTGDVVDGVVYLRTNHEAPRFRICIAPAEAPDITNWREIIPEFDTGVIADFAIAGRKLVLHVVENVRSRLIVYTLQGEQIGVVPLPGAGSITNYVAGVGPHSAVAGTLESDDLFFSFSSWAVPPRSYHFDLDTGQLTLLEETETGSDLSNITTEQVWCESADGTSVPIYIVARNDLKYDGSNPALLYGYGGFNLSFFPTFRSWIIPFVQRGGVWAIANIRGGGEFGSDWHAGGRRANKQHAFNDFFAAGEKLIELGYTRPDKLACKGGSNGGLLIGAAITQRPDLFRAAISQVPLMDMLRFHHWGMGAQWVHEYGDPEIAEEFAWLRAYSPYHNVRDGVSYPATLIVTAEGDNRVDPAHALKMVARLQAANASPHPILLRYERDAGHGAGKPRWMALRHRAEEWAFLMRELGMLGNRERAALAGATAE